MSDENKAYGVPFQRGVLHYMMIDPRFCSKACAHLKEGYFTGSLTWFYRKIREHFEQYKTCMTRSDLDHEVLKHSSEERATYAQELKDIAASGEFTFPYIQRNLTGFIRGNLYIAGYQEASTMFNAGSRQDAYEITKRKLDELLKVDFEDSRIAAFGDHEIVCDALGKQTMDAVPTGIKLIDEAMGGGMLPQTWTTFLGGSNVGKSMLGPNLAYYAAQKGKKTFITVHEDEELPTKVRFLSRFSGIPYNVLAQPRNYWTSEQALAVKKADEFLSHHVHIRFMYGQDAFLEKVQDSVRAEKQEWDFDLWFCDYGQCLKSKAYKSMDDRYGLHEYIYEQMKQTCLELYLAGAGGAQTNRSGHKVNRSGSDLVRMTDVGDSWGIAKKASNLITMNRSVKDMHDARITFLLDKVRNGRCPVAVECQTDFGCATTHKAYAENEKTQNEIPVDAQPDRDSDV